MNVPTANFQCNIRAVFSSLPFNCQDPNSTSTQQQFNQSWVWHENDFKYHPTPPHHTNSMSVISQLLLTQFWPNFKDSFLGLSWTDSNCHSDICPGNICQGDICPYQEYLSCYWPDFYQTLRVGYWDPLEQISTVTMTFVRATFVPATFVPIRNISAVTYPILTKLWR